MRRRGESWGVLLVFGAAIAFLILWLYIVLNATIFRPRAEPAQAQVQSQAVAPEQVIQIKLRDLIEVLPRKEGPEVKEIKKSLERIEAKVNAIEALLVSRAPPP